MIGEKCLTILQTVPFSQLEKTVLKKLHAAKLHECKTKVSCRMLGNVANTVT